MKDWRTYVLAASLGFNLILYSQSCEKKEGYWKGLKHGFMGTTLFFGVVWLFKPSNAI